MIVNFSIQNFSSIKSEQTLSFEADKSKHLENAYVINCNGHRLLKLALIYGANASGKTNILRALDFFGTLVLEPRASKIEKLEYQPFLFDEQTPLQNSILTLEFIQNGIKYHYGVEFNKECVVSETLNFYNPNKATVFERKTDLSSQLSEITFGSKIKTNSSAVNTLKANTLWNNTVLGGFLKTNAGIKELKDCVDWFDNYLHPLILTGTKLENYTTERIENKEVSKEIILKVLKKADFNISNIFIEKDKKSKDSISLLINLAKHELDKHFDKDSKEKYQNLSFSKIEFEHYVGNKKYKLPFEMESHGTQRYFSFAGLLSGLIEKSCAVVIDELESSLHPDLYLHFLLSFLMNSQNSQLIATTHNREILGNKDVFRNDAIWFTDKNEDCSTELYSLADFDTSVIRKETNIFNAYKNRRLKAAPNLGDYYIGL